MPDLVIAAILTLITHLPAIIDEAERKGELTPEQAAARRKQMTEAFASDAWKTDAQLNKPPET